VLLLPNTSIGSEIANTSASLNVHGVVSLLGASPRGEEYLTRLWQAGHQIFWCHTLESVKLDGSDRHYYIAAAALLDYVRLLASLSSTDVGNVNPPFANPAVDGVATVLRVLREGSGHGLLHATYAALSASADVASQASCIDVTAALLFPTLVRKATLACPAAISQHSLIELASSLRPLLSASLLWALLHGELDN
jgi:hypothetical protein